MTWHDPQRNRLSQPRRRAVHTTPRAGDPMEIGAALWQREQQIMARFRSERAIAQAIERERER